MSNFLKNSHHPTLQNFQNPAIPQKLGGCLLCTLDSHKHKFIAYRLPHIMDTYCIIIAQFIISIQLFSKWISSRYLHYVWKLNWERLPKCSKIQFLFIFLFFCPVFPYFQSRFDCIFCENNQKWPKTLLWHLKTYKNQWEVSQVKIQKIENTVQEKYKSLIHTSSYTCVKVFKNGPSKICGRQPSKYLKWYGLPNHFKFFKGSLPQILLGPFLNTLTHIIIAEKKRKTNENIKFQL